MNLAYVNGRLKALENNMLTRAELDQFAEAPETQLEKSLADRGYGADLTVSVMKKRKEDFSFIRNAIRPFDPYPDFIRSFFLKYDLLNLKNGLKLRIMKDRRISQDYPLGAYPFSLDQEDIRDILENKKFELISLRHKKMIGLYFNELEKNLNSTGVENILDRMYLHLFWLTVQEMKNDYFSFYFSHYLDLVNIENIIRFKLLGRSLEELERTLFLKGTLKRIMVKELFTGKLEDIPDAFKARPYYDILKTGIEKGRKENQFGLFHLLKDNYLMTIIRMARLCSFGIEPVFSYLAGKENEYMNIRIIVEGRRKRIKPGRIRENIRETYV